MDCGKLMVLHDDLLHLEGTAAMLAASGRCSSEAENAFLLIAGEIKRIRMELFGAIGESARYEGSEAEQ